MSSGLAGMNAALTRLHSLMAATPAAATPAVGAIGRPKADDAEATALRVEIETLREQMARLVEGDAALPAMKQRLIALQLQLERAVIGTDAQREAAAGAAGGRGLAMGGSAEKAIEDTEEAAKDAQQTIRQLKMGATATVSAGLRSTTDAMRDAVDRAGEDLGYLGGEAVETFAAAGDEFGSQVDRAGRTVTAAADRAEQLLNQLLNFVSGGGDLVSGAFDPNVKGGQSDAWKKFGQNGGGASTDPFGVFNGPNSANNGVGVDSGQMGGSISNDYAVTLIREWVGRLQYNQRTQGDARANVIRTQVMNDIGMARLQGYWDRMFSRFGRLQDVAMAYMKRMERADKRNRRSTPTRGYSGSNPSTGLLG